MKILIFIKSICLAMLVVLASGCSKFLDINVDPTLTADATMQELLPTAQLYTSEASYYQAYVACQWAQQLGSALGSNGTDTYAETDNTLGWSSFYLNVLPQLKTIIKKGETEGATAYVGIAKTLMAYNLGVATSNWENVPYNDADNGDFSPAYQSQQEVYDIIQKLLDEAIVELGKNSGAKPGADDMIYQGDIGKWTRLAYSLKARYAMHLALKKPEMIQTALTALQNGMKSNDDDFQLKYNSKNLSPWYSRVALPNSTNNFSVTFANTYVDLMNGKVQGVVDPRISKVVPLKGTQTVYSGVTPGTGSGSTVDLTIKGWHSNIDSPLVMATYSEMKAVEAEARFLANGGTMSSVGSTPAAFAAYQEMISSNMKKVGVVDKDIAAFLAVPAIGADASKLTLKQIIQEKYKSMLLIGDIWTDIRKYEYLDFQMPQNVNPDLKGLRIQRMKYPDTEETRNSKTVNENRKAPEVKMWMLSK